MMTFPSRKKKTISLPTIDNSKLKTKSCFAFACALLISSELMPSQAMAEENSSESVSSEDAPQKAYAPSLQPLDRQYEPVHVPEVALPDPAAGIPVTLDEILAFADQNAPRLRVAREKLGLGDAAIEKAQPWLAYNPQASMSAGPRLTAAGAFVELQGSISQQFEVAGERGMRLAAAEKTKKRFEAQLDEVRWQVHRDVHAAFHRTLVARARLQAAKRLLGFQERLLKITQARLAVGDVSPLSVRLAEGELSQTRVAKIAAEQAYLRSRLQLGALVSWPEQAPPDPAGTLDTPKMPPAHADLQERATAHQPRLKTLQARRIETLARARAADRDGWPAPTLGLQFAREGAPTGAEETVIMGTLSVPLPVFQRNLGPRAKAHAKAKVADAKELAFTSQLGIRIEQHRTAVAAAAARVRTYGGEILPTFEKNLRLIQRAFELGEIDILQVSVARERFLRIQTDSLDAYADYFKAVANLEGTIGTDLWPDEHTGKAPKVDSTVPNIEPVQMPDSEPSDTSDSDNESNAPTLNNAAPLEDKT